MLVWCLFDLGKFLGCCVWNIRYWEIGFFCILVNMEILLWKYWGNILLCISFFLWRMFCLGGNMKFYFLLFLVFVGIFVCKVVLNVIFDFGCIVCWLFWIFLCSCFFLKCGYIYCRWRKDKVVLLVVEWFFLWCKNSKMMGLE